MSNQTEDQINLTEFEDLKPLKNQDLDTVSVDSSNIKVPKYYNFFALKLKEKYTFYSDPVNLPTLNSDQIKILNKLIALNKSLDFKTSLKLSFSIPASMHPKKTLYL